MFGLLSASLSGTAHTYILREKSSAAGLTTWKRLVDRSGLVLYFKRSINFSLRYLNWKSRARQFISSFDSKIAELGTLAAATGNKLVQEQVLATHLYAATIGSLREHLNLNPRIRT